ncbi:MAG: response regulator transcription factor [Akkermansiaceae bacterium]|jgi:DNA-binding response OmpR family regulator|nr:response regulator transcription factor [Akkermansiaceae bacterium]
METTLLVIEDDPAVRQGVVDALEYGGYRTLQASDAVSGLEMALRASYRLLLLDLVLPGGDGFGILAELRRKRPGQPVIILSARGEEDDRVRGLELGADDYVMKPFSVRELLARVEAVLRRTCERAAPEDRRKWAGGLIDFSTGEVEFGDGGCEVLSDREASLLRYLMDAGGRVVSKEEILRQLWGLDPAKVETRTLDMHVMHLRTKLRDRSAEKLVTVRGKGWRFCR